jgi:CRP-like cAMP-binding protein
VEELLALTRGLPRRWVEPGEVLLVDGEPVSALYVLLEGELRIEKRGVLIARVSEPGACVGEMSLLLGTSATADVVAGERSAVAILDTARAMLDADSGLSISLARLLASRLHTMTTYLVDLKEQYGDHEGGLGMVDVVLGTLLRSPGTRTELGSDRDPEPEY